MTEPMFAEFGGAAEVRPSGLLFVRVAGIPIPQGSMRGFVSGGRAILTSDNPRLRFWRREVTTALSEARAGVCFAGPIRLTVTFALPRPTGHFGRRGLLPSAPARPAGARDDLDKLIRAIGDAATNAGVWRDDGQVVELHADKRWAGTEDGPGAVVEICELIG